MEMQLYILHVVPFIILVYLVFLLFIRPPRAVVLKLEYLLAASRGGTRCHPFARGAFRPVVPAAPAWRRGR